ncbi:DUF349 domain-containing protein [Ottowia sp.]|uniref:DUF349 domain-containing protein n=1 Tax=Ottowia sp. TaxID=1898956 RepID=UPI003A8708B7
MFPFSRDSKDASDQAQDDTPAKAPEAHPLDALTGGAFSAATSGERAQRVRDWLATDPGLEQMQEVYKELSHKDKGAAKALREKLDEVKRTSQQDAVAQDWADKAQALLAAARLNIADAMAWQRDAAKAGAPLSREPLSGLRTELVERVKKVEDLQQRVMVQREAAALLAQRIELLSTKPLADAEGQQSGLDTDVAHWRSQANQLLADEQWLSVDMRYPPQLEAAQSQLAAVWDAFSAALAQALTARADSAAPLPPVPVWADELRLARGEVPVAAPEKPAKPKIDPEQRAAAQKAVETGTMLLEQAVAAGHTKNMHSATNALRQSLKKHGRLIDDALEARVHAALVSAGELEGWQRWSADKVREQLLARAEALLVKRKIKGTPSEDVPAKDTSAKDEAAQTTSVASTPAAEQAVAPAPAPVTETTTEESTTEPAAATNTPAAPASEALAGESTPPSESVVSLEVDRADAAAETIAANEESASTSSQSESQEQNPETAAPALEPGYEMAPAMGGRKLQDAIRKLREEWKTADQGGAPNHALWKRFDRAINAAHKFVDEWLTTVRAEAAEHKAQRLALIEEVTVWASANAGPGDDVNWKDFNRQIHRFSDRWRNAGHLSEKQYAELQPRWKEAIHTAVQPLEAVQKQSTARRQALIAEAESMGAAPQLRIDAVKDLQSRWQAEAQAVPLDRKHEQKLWDAFRKPLDDAFNRKGAQRQAQRAAMSAHDKAVLDAAKALEAANASGDAQQIRAAIAALEAATHGDTPAPQATTAQSEKATVAADSKAQPSAELAASAAGEGTQATANDTQNTAPSTTPPAVDAATNTSAPSDADAPPSDTASDGEAASAPESACAPTPGSTPAPAPAAPKRVVAVRGDDRPGQKKDQPAPAGRGGRGGDRRGSAGPGGRAGERGARSSDRFGERFGGRASRDDRAPRGPRMGDTAFRAQRDAVEHAQAALKKLAAQAHGETLTQLLGAWAERQSEQVPSAQELGRAVTGSVRSAWAQALQSAPQGDASQALLRLEMAAEVPTPAEQIDARRALQLQLLTRRNEPGPRETWTDDAAQVLASGHNDAAARRLQSALKVLMRK